MAYVNVNFPTPKLIHGIKRETSAPVEVVTNFNVEYRLKRYANERYRWTIPARYMRQADIDTIVTFFTAVNWMKDSFNFTDPLDGTEYVVRLDQPNFSYVYGALDSNNKPIVSQLSDIILISVLNEA
jgi:hypothetical protein